MTASFEHLRRARRDELLNRATAGDQNAAFQLFGFPWSLEGLGPTLDDPQVLQRIEQAVLGSTGRPATFSENEEIRWIESDAALEAAFLSSLRDTNDRRWTDFVEQAVAIWSEIAALESGIDDDPAPSFAALDELFDLVRRTEDATLRCLDTAWTDAFETGRVLVVEGKEEGWRFRAPGHWQPAPPFALIAPHQKLAAAKRNYDALRRRLKARLPKTDSHATINAFRKIERAVDLVGSFSKPLLPDLEVSRGIASPPNHLDAPIGAKKRSAKRLYLLSGQLSKTLRAPVSFEGVGPRSKETRLLEEDLLTWFRNTIRNQPRMTRDQAMAAIAAEATSRTGITDGWGRMAKRVWDAGAPSAWRQAGRPRRSKSQ